MELTKKQIQEIDNYITVCGIKYFDVKTEIVDHFASILELRLDENPDLDFKEAIIEEHKKFSDRGFKKLLATKTKTTHNRFVKQTIINFKSFFKLPKIIIIICCYLLLYKMVPYFNDIKTFFMVLTVFGFILILQLGIRIVISYKQKKERFLALNRMTLFYQIASNMFILFNCILSFRTDKSFLNNGYNNIHLGVFVLILLLYWSMEYVYQQNRKQIKKQYSNVFI